VTSAAEHLGRTTAFVIDMLIGRGGSGSTSCCSNSVVGSNVPRGKGRSTAASSASRLSASAAASRCRTRLRACEVRDVLAGERRGVRTRVRSMRRPGPSSFVGTLRRRKDDNHHGNRAKAFRKRPTPRRRGFPLEPRIRRQYGAERLRAGTAGARRRVPTVIRHRRAGRSAAP